MFRVPTLDAPPALRGPVEPRPTKPLTTRSCPPVQFSVNCPPHLPIPQQPLPRAILDAPGPHHLVSASEGSAVTAGNVVRTLKSTNAKWPCMSNRQTFSVPSSFPFSFLGPCDDGPRTGQDCFSPGQTTSRLQYPGISSLARSWPAVLNRVLSIPITMTLETRTQGAQALNTPPRRNFSFFHRLPDGPTRPIHSGIVSEGSVVSCNGLAGSMG